jgi:hypothetical protein
MTLPILVTGGTGRLRRRGVRRLVATGCGIRVLTRHGRQAADGVQFLTGDLPPARGRRGRGRDGRRRSAGDEPWRGRGGGCRGAGIALMECRLTCSAARSMVVRGVGCDGWGMS